MFPDNLIQAAGQLDPTWFAFACAFILLDVLTGIAKGASQHAISSEILRKGFWHKLANISALIVAGLVDCMQYTGHDIGFTVPIFAASCGYIVVMEVVSILENLSVMNSELAGTKLMALFAPAAEALKSDEDDSAED